MSRWLLLDAAPAPTEITGMMIVALVVFVGIIVAIGLVIGKISKRDRGKSE